MDGNLDQVLSQWTNDKSVFPNVIHWRKTAATPAKLRAFPPDMEIILKEGLKFRGIQQLYSHQVESWDYAEKGDHIVVVSGTASGKTMCYTLPILQRLIQNPEQKAMLLFPTKALAADQVDDLQAWTAWVNREYPARIRPAVYDGDTPAGQRPGIRKNVNLLVTNPDMLHLGILPHHTRWEAFFRGLAFVVIDEMHIYRGVFGSHFANVIRRLKRISTFYGGSLQFIMTSATVANPGEHGKRLIDEAKVSLINHDGAPHGERNFLLYNPPIINEELGIRGSASAEAMRLTSDFFRNHTQTILFSRTRRGVEMILRQLKERHGDSLGEFRAYRSGYLAEDRRDIERNLRNGSTRVVVATSALELGIDIGGLDASVLVGYPGTIAATLQQTGRAGRGMEPACAVLVASANPLDQYLIQHPDYFFERNPEKVLIDPDNLLILLKHLQCALFELPLHKDEPFGSLDSALLSALLQVLTESGMIHEGADQYFWMDTDYPASHISLRSTSENTVLLQIHEEERVQTIGEVDEYSSYWMTHPEAIYLHGGESYYVETLDLEKKVAVLTRFWGDYYTDPVKDIQIEKLSEIRQRQSGMATVHRGEIMVKSQVVGYRRVRWDSREIVDVHDMLMPVNTLRTTAYWIQLSEDMVSGLRSENSWSNDPNDYGPTWNALRTLAKRRDQFRCQLCGAIDSGEKPLHVHHKIPFQTFSRPEYANQLDNLVTLCSSCHREAEKNVKMKSGLAGLQYVLHHLAPLELMCDMGDLESSHDAKADWAADQPSIILYELIPAGIGFADQLYEGHERLIAEAYELVRDCPCKDGCPSCVGPAGENGSGGKVETLALLRLLAKNIPFEVHGEKSN